MKYSGKKDRFEWFKFSPLNWMSGQFQYCSELTLARYLRISCLYWNSECVLSYDDAITEIGKEHLEILISRRILVVTNNSITIPALLEQFLKKKKQQSIIRIEASSFISKKEVRLFIFNQYGTNCLCCGDSTNISIDHIIPVSIGGENTLDNLQPLCRKCNSSKGKKIIDYRAINNKSN